MTDLVRGIRSVVSQKKRRFRQGEYDLDLTYITPRIIAMGFPSSGTEGIYRNPLPEVQRFFQEFHAGKFMIFNLCSEREYAAEEFGGAVQRFPFDDHNPCPFNMIADFCASVDRWLGADKHNVVAVHCKAGKGRTGLMVAAYLLHSGYKPTAQRALSYFGDARTANAQGVTIPSQMRWVHYYEHVMRHGPAAPQVFRITLLRVLTVPAVDQLKGGCTPYFTVSVDGKEVFDWRRHTLKLRKYRKSALFMDMDCTGVDCIVRSNVKVSLYGDKMPAPVKLCHVWFHADFCAHNYLSFSRSSIDEACKDKSNRFDEEFGIELYMEKLVDDGIEPVASLPYSSRSIGVTAEGAAAFSDGKLFTKPAHAAAVTLFKT